MAEKERKEEEDKAVEEQKKAEQPQQFTFQILTENHVMYDEFCGFGPHEAGNAWVRLVGPDGAAMSWGFFPTNHEQTPVSPTYGRVADPSTTGYEPEHVRSFTIGADRAAEVMSAAEKRKNEPGQYDVVNNNCATFAAQLAQRAGVSISLQEILLPNQREVVRRMAQMRVEKGGNKAVDAEAEK